MFTQRSSREWLRVAVLLVVVLSGTMLPPGGTLLPRVGADSTPQAVPFRQDWTNTGLITANDNWSGVPGITGFLETLTQWGRSLGTNAAKGELIESLNRGLGIVSYFGHGNVDQWRGDLLTSADAGANVPGDVPERRLNWSGEVG